MFIKNDYLVITCDSSFENQYVTNYCYKQRENSSYLQSFLDNDGRFNNGWDTVNFFNENTWRYATKQEVVEYDLRGCPYNTAELNKKEEKFDYLIPFLEKL